MLTIFGALGFMAAGAGISELYHRRMWLRYQEGKREMIEREERLELARKRNALR